MFTCVWCVYEFMRVRVNVFVCDVCVHEGKSWYVRVCAAAMHLVCTPLWSGYTSTQDVFLDHSQPYFLRHSLSLTVELTDWPELAGLWVPESLLCFFSAGIVLNYLTQLVMWALGIKDLKCISCELACVQSHFLGLRFPIQKPIIRCKVQDLLLGCFFLNTGKNIKERHQALSWLISKHQTNGISLQTVDQTFYLPRTKLIHCVSFSVDHISWSLVISNFNDCSLNMSDCDECQVQIYMNQP